MPLVFVHGVNTRDTDDNYYRAGAARKKMFETYVVPAVRKHGFPNFRVHDDIYWGDLGVAFLWNLKSIPPTNVVDYLGAAEEGEPDNLALLEVMSAAQGDAPAPASSSVETLGPESGTNVLAAAAARDPGALVRAIFSPEAHRFAPVKPDSQIDAARRDDAAIEQRKSEGEQLALLLQAVDSFAEAATADRSLIEADDDDAVLEKITSGVRLRYAAMLKRGTAADAEPETEHLGKVRDAIEWAWGRAQDAIDAARNLAQDATATTLRAGSLLLSENYRAGFSSRGLRFFGDVLVFLQRGRTADPSILQRVKQGLEACKPANDDPLIIVTHSFGSEIVYELLTSGVLDGMTVHLWVTAGAQTSLFAEMRLYTASPQDVPSEQQPFLGKPNNVRRWINVYDAADVLSFVHEPVFGRDAVTDISLREGAHLANAHGGYFLAPFFYQVIASAADEVLKQR
jgi:hypothetical protein